MRNLGEHFVNKSTAALYSAVSWFAFVAGSTEQTCSFCEGEQHVGELWLRCMAVCLSIVLWKTAVLCFIMITHVIISVQRSRWSGTTVVVFPLMHVKQWPIAICFACTHQYVLHLTLTAEQNCNRLHHHVIAALGSFIVSSEFRPHLHCISILLHVLIHWRMLQVIVEFSVKKKPLFLVQEHMNAVHGYILIFFKMYFNDIICLYLGLLRGLLFSY
jgi:hypothetical protein